MVTKHFFKILTIFVAMIILGLVVLLSTDYFDKDAVQATNANNKIQVAK